MRAPSQEELLGKVSLRQYQVLASAMCLGLLKPELQRHTNTGCSRRDRRPHPALSATKSTTLSPLTISTSTWRAALLVGRMGSAARFPKAQQVSSAPRAGGEKTPAAPSEALESVEEVVRDVAESSQGRSACSRPTPWTRSCQSPLRAALLE